MPRPPLARLALSLAVAVAVSAPPARAGLVIVPFSGTVTSVDFNIPDPARGFVVGRPFTGQLAYDPAQLVSSGPDPNGNDFLAYILPVSYELTIGGTVTYSGTLPGEVDVFHGVQDGVVIRSGAATGAARLALGSLTPRVLPSAALPTSLDPDAFPIASFTYFVGSGADRRGISSNIRDTTPAPEPPTLALTAIGLATLAGWGWWRRQGLR